MGPSIFTLLAKRAALSSYQFQDFWFEEFYHLNPN